MADSSVEERWRDFYSDLIELSEQILKVKTTHGEKNKEKAWWSHQAKEAVKEKMTCFRRWIQTRKLEGRERWKE